MVDAVNYPIAKSYLILVKGGRSLISEWRWPLHQHPGIKLIMEIPFPSIRTSLYCLLTNDPYGIILANALAYTPDEKAELLEEKTYDSTLSFFP